MSEQTPLSEASLRAKLNRLGIDPSPEELHRIADFCSANPKLQHDGPAPESAEQAVEKIIIQLSQLWRIAVDGAKSCNPENERLVTDWRDKELSALERRRSMLKNWYETRAIVVRGAAGRAGVVFANRPANSAVSWLTQACEHVTTFMHKENWPGHWNEANYQQLADSLTLDPKTVEKIRAEANWELAKSGYDPPAPVQFNVPPGAVKESPDGFSYVIEAPGSLVDKAVREREADRIAGHDEALAKVRKALDAVLPLKADGSAAPAVQAGRASAQSGKPNASPPGGAAKTAGAEVADKYVTRPHRDEPFSKLDEIKRAISILRGVFTHWHDFYTRYAGPIKAFDDYGVKIPPIVIGANGEGAGLAQDTRLALGALYGHGIIPPALRACNLEDAIGKFPAWPTGAISAARNKAFLGDLPVQLDKQTLIYVELGDLETQLEFAPLSILECADMAPAITPAGSPALDAEARGGGKRPVATQSRTLPVDFAPIGYRFERNGNVWHLQYQNEKTEIADDLDGLVVIARLLQKKHTARPALELEGHDGSRIPRTQADAPTLDDTAICDLQREHHENEEAMKEVVAFQDQTEFQKLKHRNEQIESQLCADVGLGGKARLLSSGNEGKKAADRVRKAIAAVRKRLRKQDIRMPNLCNHLDCIKKEGDKFAYRPSPPEPDWHISY